MVGPVPVSVRWDLLVSWHADWSGLRVVVMGVDARGFAVADTLAELGSDVSVLARESSPGDLAQLHDVIGVGIDVAPSDAEAIEYLGRVAPDIIVSSGELGPRHPLVEWAGTAGVTVVSDIEVAWRLRDKVGTAAPWLLVTGGDGGGRTAHLAESMLLANGTRAMACGDTDQQVPVLDALRVPEVWDCLVVSLSSRDLHFSPSVSGWAAVCLTATTAHHDDDGDEQSQDDLARVYSGARVACVYNRDDARTMAMVEEADVVEGCRAIGFGLGIPGPSDFGVVEGILCDRAFLDARRDSALEFATLELLHSAGLVTAEATSEVLAAAALARAFGTPIAAVNSALQSRALPAE